MKARRLLLLGAAALALAALAGGRLASSPSSSRGFDQGVGTASLLAAPPRSALTIPTPKPLQNGRETVRWAPVVQPALARTTPDRGAPVVARLERRTAEGTPNSVLVLMGARDSSGRVWVKARLPVLPNGSSGWVPRSAVGGYRFLHTHLVIDTRRFTATLMRDGRPIFEAAVGVGKPMWPTPKGEFYVRNKLTSFDSPFYGPLAFGTSARSSVLTDWPAGGFIGIHGTNEPELLPGRVSHGCVRMRNEDILRLGTLMPVGTPISIL